MSADERDRRLENPIPPAEVEVGVADARADHLDETLAGLELRWSGDGEVVLHDDGLLGPGDDGCDLGPGDSVMHGGWLRDRGLLEGFGVIYAVAYIDMYMLIASAKTLGNRHGSRQPPGI